MATPKPTFVIVPGAWHPPSCYDTIVSHLRAAGYPTLVASLPSLNAREPATATCTADAESVRRQVLPLIENEGKDVLLVSHSYGGIPAGGAALGLSKSTRTKDGHRGGIIGMVYISSFVVPEGLSLLGLMGGKHPTYVKENRPSSGLCEISPATELLFSDVDAGVAGDLEGLLLPHALKALESPAPPAAWAEPAFEGRVAFLRCTEDQALPTFVQDLFVEQSGVKWIVKDLKTSHSPYVSQPQKVTEDLTELVHVFQGVRS